MTAPGTLPTAGPGARESGPRFLGWRMLGFYTVLITLTVPGQTIGVAVFIDYFVADLGISRAQVSAAYLVGTSLGALSLPAVGRFIDRRGARISTAAIGLCFGAALIATGAVQGLVTLAVAFVGIRMLGQGSLMLAGQTGVALWFERRRGFAMALAITISSGAMAFAPLVFTLLIDGVGWRGAWVVLGLAVWATVVPIALLGLIDRPSDVGQRPDGAPALTRTAVSDQSPRGATASDAIRTPAFWGISLVSALSAAFGTGVLFHHVSIMEGRGLSEAQAAAVFLPQAAGAIAAGFAFGWMSDRVASRILIPVSGGLLAAGLALATVAAPGWPAVLYGIALGASLGAIRSVTAVVLPNWFGVTHIGSIRGLEHGITVAASATGPLIIALGNDWFDGYAPVLLACAGAAALAALFTAMMAEPPRHGAGAAAG